MPHRQPRKHVTPLLSSYTNVYDLAKKGRSRALQFTNKLNAEGLKVIGTRLLVSQPIMYDEEKRPPLTTQTDF